jgi:F-type H+-transporting ATPase subunit delta
MVAEVDPAIVGGFVFTVDDLMLDASVARQIELIRRQFVEKNNRIV